MAGIKPPRPFDFQNAADWPAWMDEFDDYRFASGLHEKPDEVQVRTLLYTMGRKSREILRSLNVKDEEMEDFDLVKSKFKGYFVHTKNTVYESARFNLRRQQLGKTVDQFATELNRLADRCEFKEMKERLIRDRFVVGLRYHLLSEELQMDPNLTLSTALAKARTSETVKKQQAELKEHEGTITEACVAAVKPEKTPGKSKKFTRGHKPAYREKSCSFCAGPFHPRNSCPAKQERCRFCRTLGHFEKACRKKRRADGNLDDIAEADKFLGTVERSANTPSEHFVTVLINDHKLRMKILRRSEQSRSGLDPKTSLSLLNKDSDWCWGTQQEEAFEKIKTTLSSNRCLARYPELALLDQGTSSQVVIQHLKSIFFARHGIPKTAQCRVMPPWRSVTSSIREGSGLYSASKLESAFAQSHFLSTASESALAKMP
ncbi:uncharacterized protein [Dermacentor albipictus]|uniref:uncharacterized protein n=1 Tax=Dermacentor albipictus TaxID=60249 RepID=UPI0038FC8BD3